MLDIMSTYDVQEEISLMVEDKAEIRKIILDNFKSGDEFWSHEIVTKYNLELGAAVDVLNELVKEGELHAQ